MTFIRPRSKRYARKRRGPLFVFVTSATIAGLLGHAALLSSVDRGSETEWKMSAPPELVREIGDQSGWQLAMNGER